jgi:hypothetical protein
MLAMARSFGYLLVTSAVKTAYRNISLIGSPRCALEPYRNLSLIGSP